VPAEPITLIPRASLLLGLTTLAYAVGCFLVFVTARYRLPLAVPLLPLAGEGVSTGLALAGAVRRPRGQAVPRLHPLSLVAIGALLVAVYRPLPAADRDDPAIAAVNLGVLQEAQGDLESAIGAYRRAIALRPDFALAHFNLGVAERRRGHLAAADSAFREALRLDPRYADAFDQLAMTHEQAGDLETARVLYERAIAIDSTRPRYYKDLGRLHVLRGDAAAAAGAWERALRLDPADSTTAGRLRALRAAGPAPPPPLAR
jgi:tetratricopeptide (TPR) repeat protein